MSILKRCGIYVWFIAVMACTAVMLLWAVYSLPVAKMKENVRLYTISGIMEPSMLPINFYGFPIDGFTDSLMLNNTVFERENAFHTALLNPRVQIDALDQMGNLQLALNQNKPKHVQLMNYPRFWHGYLIFLKPLFCFFNLQQIRFLNLFLQLALLIAAGYLMSKRIGIKHCFAFLCGIFILNPLTTWQCLEYANVMNVMLLAVLWVLLNKNPNDNYMFFVIGAVTILFDFLTFPLITLGIPLIVYICLYQRSFKENIFCVLKNSLLWGIGYAGMLFCKWVLATALTEENVIQDGWYNVLHRTYEFGNVFNIKRIVDTWHTNLGFIENNYTVIMLVSFCVAVGISYFFCSYRFRLNSKALILLGISLMPFVWYGVLVNHSLVHPHWTYKILSIAVYAILAAVVCCLQSVLEEKRNDKKAK